MSSLSQDLKRFAEASASACGWFVGFVDADTARCVPLTAVRCLRVTPAGGPDWAAEPGPPAGLVPAGLHVVGAFAVCDGADQLLALYKPYLDQLSAQLSPEAHSAGGGIALAAVGAGGDAEFFSGKLSGGALQLQPTDAPSRDEAEAAFRAQHVALHVSCALPLSVECPAADDAWGKAQHAALEEARGALLASLAPTALRFFFPGAPQAGVCSATMDAAGATTVGALAGGEAGGEDDEDDEEEEEEEEGAGRKKGGKPKKGGGAKGKKGGGKKGGKKRPGGGGGGAAAAGGGGGGSAAEEAAAEAADPDRLEVQLLWPLSPAAGSACTPPVLRCEGVAQGARLVWPLGLEDLVYARRATPLAAALAALQASLAARAEALVAAVPRGGPTPRAARACVPCALVFQPAALPTAVRALYALREEEGPAEQSLQPQRAQLHAALGLPVDRPLLRSSNALGRAAGAGGRPFPGLLSYVHEGLAPSGVKAGEPALVQGECEYEYFHYMQRTGHAVGTKGYDDAGWGCAYRSLQSIISWFRLQQYTAFRNPTHYEIQQRLVDHCGQSRDELLGKKMWIGSLELGLFLEHALGVECRTASYQSGDDVAADGRRLAHHFQTQGTPVMIGGGQLAFTLLGVHWDPTSGDIRYLIMDPHYTGADDLAQIQPKWVGWKSADSPTHLGTKLFDKDVFYNLCFPQRPNCI